MKTNKFKLGELVTVRGLLCEIVEIDLTHDELEVDYLCKPINPYFMVYGQDEVGPGWVFESDIKKTFLKIKFNKKFNQYRNTFKKIYGLNN